MMELTNDPGRGELRTLRRLLWANAALSLVAIAASGYAVLLHSASADRWPAHSLAGEAPSRAQPYPHALEKDGATEPSSSQFAAHASVNGALSLDISEGSITAYHIADSSVSTAEVADHAITSEKLAYAAVVEPSLADGAVSSAKLAAGAVSDANLGADAVGSGALKDGAVTAEKIGYGAVGSRQLARAAVGGLALAEGAVSAAHLKDGEVVSSKLGAGAVSSSKLANGAVTQEKLAPGSVVEAYLVDGAVGRRQVQPAAIDSERIADGSVGASDINIREVQARVEASCREGTFMTAITDRGDVACSSVGLTSTDVFGVVGESGRPERGRGFNSWEEGSGVYKLSFDTAFTNPPVIVVAPMAKGGMCSAEVDSEGERVTVRCQKKTWRDTWEFGGVPFSFIAIAAGL